MKSPRCFLSALAGFTALVLNLPAPASAQEARLVDLATTAQVGSGANVLTVGFVITGSAKKTVLIRGVGPGLAAFVGGTVADPNLALFNASNTVIATNDNWGTPLGGTLPITAATFASVGAFALPANSKDAAIQIALDPGLYTAQMSAGTAAAGLGIVEVYEMDTNGGKLTNISTSGNIATGGNMIAGLVIAPGAGLRKLLVRAAGPGLTPLVAPGTVTIADPQFKIIVEPSKTTVASNDNWSTPVGASALDAATLATIAQLAGAFAFPNGSKDAMAYIELGAGSYTVQVTGTGAGGLGIVEVYDLTPATPPTVTIAATKAAADESGNNNGEFTITRAGDARAPLTVAYGAGGSAVNGYDYTRLSGTITIPAGASSVKLPLLPIPNLQAGTLDTAVVTITSDPGYSVGVQNSATVTIAQSPTTLYISSLRPASNATGSTSSGTATILLSASGTVAGVNITFSNLSSAEVTAHLTLGVNDDFVFNLPQGQVSGVLWTFAPTGLYTSADLVNALKSGNISVRIDTANYPSGEVKGAFVQGVGVQAFTPPTAPPAVSLTGVTAADAARLLTQATFGPKRAEIDALTGGSIDTWLTAQLALPFTSHRQAVLDDKATYGGSNSFTNWNAIHPPNRQSAWFKTVLTAQDQLRQRVAFALSELFVTSDVSLGDDSRAEPLANYYDILGNGAFGSFRALLENVTLSPMMGEYLSSLRNSKANPVTGQTPDENYAREVMQLFTIGLNLLQRDGTLQLGIDGLPIATYTQPTVTEMAKVFTGWAYNNTVLSDNNFRNGRADLINPMVQYANFHDLTPKNIVNNVVLPPNQNGATDLKQALDTLANHPNTGPFVSRHLIQRLVTSNPSPAYVYRVAQVFADDGTSAHTRGNLGAVVRAILTDYEARSPVVAANVTYGKLKEPLLRLTTLLRAFNASSASGRYLGYQNTANGTPITGTTPLPAAQNLIGSLSGAVRYDNVQSLLDQAALRSPTVFNFFHSTYVLPGALASAGLIAPEYEITDATYSIDVPNLIRNVIFSTATGTGASYSVVPDFITEQTLASTPAALLDHLNLVLCAGNLSATTRTRVTTALAALPASATALERVQSAVLVIATTSDGATQK